MGQLQETPIYQRIQSSALARNHAGYINPGEKQREDWAELGLHETGFGELGEAVEPKRRRPPCLRHQSENL
jgi:hypothetical protein